MASEIKLEEPDNTVSLTSSRGPSRIATQKDQTVSVKKGVVVSEDESDEETSSDSDGFEVFSKDSSSEREDDIERPEFTVSITLKTFIYY